MTQSAVRIDFDVNRVSSALNIPAVQVLNKVAFDIFREIVRGTPVDTGRARANWSLGINAIPTGQIEVNKKTKLSPSSATSTAIKNAIGKKAQKATDIIYIANNVDYVYYLEFGTPHIQPFGMVANALAAARANFAAVIAAIGRGSFTARK